MSCSFCGKENGFVLRLMGVPMLVSFGKVYCFKCEGKQRRGEKLPILNQRGTGK